MRYGGILNRRIVQLERAQQPSTRGKLQDVQHAALAMMSYDDRKLLKEFKDTAAYDAQASGEHAMAVDRFNKAFVDALIAEGSRFSIAEMDQFVGLA
jgi:hypothetical protein